MYNKAAIIAAASLFSSATLAAPTYVYYIPNSPSSNLHTTIEPSKLEAKIV